MLRGNNFWITNNHYCEFSLNPFKLDAPNTSSGPANGGPSGGTQVQKSGSPTTRKRLTLAEKKHREMMIRVERAGQELLSHFNYRNMDAIVRVTRNSLEYLRKRIASTMTIRFGKSKVRDVRPCYKAYAVLIVPLISMQPTLDEVQQALSKAANLILSVSKGVSHWSKQRKAAKVVAIVGQLRQPAPQFEQTRTSVTTKQGTTMDGGEEQVPPSQTGEVVPESAGAPDQADGRQASQAAQPPDSALQAQPSQTASQAQPAATPSQTQAQPSDRVTSATRKVTVVEAPPPPVAPMQIVILPRNYFRNVSDNKEIAKLVSFLSTLIMTNSEVPAFRSIWPSCYVYVLSKPEFASTSLVILHSLLILLAFALFLSFFLSFSINILGQSHYLH